MKIQHITTGIINSVYKRIHIATNIIIFSNKGQQQQQLRYQQRHRQFDNATMQLLIT
jgi:hypothetical protein